ncbi:MAG: hypothetical protein HY755_10720 [Nitrospirae bacterium]|nr:hypothetical protein [Nitrospirota bacterium]
MKKIYICLFCFCIFLSILYGLSFSQGGLQLPVLSSPEEYGDIFIDRVSTKNKVTPVVFSHWIHRVKYTCRVCHDELEIAMKSSETEILCGKGEAKGERHCVKCHNGKESFAFAPKDAEGENCKRCHNADSSPNRQKFFELQGKLPRSKFGNEIDWGKALNDGLIKPKDSLSDKTRTIVHDKILTLKAEMSGISPAVFPHKTHEQWLDCANCHPEIFNIKKKTTKNLKMANMLKGEACAICHLRVAFPLNDCKRCHPKMRG